MLVAPIPIVALLLYAAVLVADTCYFPSLTRELCIRARGRMKVSEIFISYARGDAESACRVSGVIPTASGPGACSVTLDWRDRDLCLLSAIVFCLTGCLMRRGRKP